MKFFLSPPATDAGQQFFTRYASLIPKLKLPGYLSQIVSGLTEWGILYALIFSSLAVFWPSYAAPTGIIGASVGVTILEGGLRALLPFSVRAIITRRWQGLDGWISGIVLALTVLLLGASGFLSFAGSRSLVESIAAPPVEATATATDSLATAEAELVKADWKLAEAELVEAYDVRLDAVGTAAAATVRRLDGQLATLRTKEATTGQKFTTRRAQLAELKADATADRDEQLAALTTEREAQLAHLRSRYRGRLSAITAARDSARQSITTTNASALTDHQTKVSRYGGGLAWFTVLCLVVLIVSIAVDELHKAGAGIETIAEPDAYTFEGSAVTAFREAVASRGRRFIFGLVHHIERGTPEAPEPVNAPTIWQRERQLKITTIREGVRRRLKPLKPMEGPESAPVEPERRLAGFTRTDTPEASTAAPRALYSTQNKHVNTKVRKQVNTKTGKHETPEAREIKQRLKLYKKRLGEHTQKAKVQQRTTGQIKSRTADAIENNREWVKHYEAQLAALTS